MRFLIYWADRMDVQTELKRKTWMLSWLVLKMIGQLRKSVHQRKRLPASLQLSHIYPVCHHSPQPLPMYSTQPLQRHLLQLLNTTRWYNHSIVVVYLFSIQQSPLFWIFVKQIVLWFETSQQFDIHQIIRIYFQVDFVGHVSVKDFPVGWNGTPTLQQKKFKAVIHSQLNTQVSLL